MPDSFIGRQAIYDRGLEVHGYELLYRDTPESDTADFVDGDHATATVVDNAFFEIGAQNLVGDTFCFVNLTEGFITGRLPLPLPPERIVVEVLEHVLPSPEVLKGLRELKSQGARIALDDYVERDGDGPLLELCDYVKIDLSVLDHEEVAALVQRLEPHEVALVAEKVECERDLQVCRDLGFDYFQGFFLTRPETLRGTSMPANLAGLLRMLQELMEPDADLDDIADIIGRDPALAHKLLRYSNSAAFGPEQPISTLPQVIVLLGLQMVRKIVSLLLLVAIDDRPGDLLDQTIVRARMCELIAEAFDDSEPGRFYTAGLFSTLDILTGTTMEAAIDGLPLAEELRSALLEGTGVLGEVLECVRAFERADWDRARFPGLEASTLSGLYARAVTYSQELWGSLPPEASAA